IEPLIEVMQDPESEVREVALEALGESSDPRVIRPIREALKDEHAGIREMAALVLKKKGM
ncbi:MAG TPA: HEAT repeat domain-containing protein, partial [Methanomicrobiales archaeon]|nr:HEAT repeat domain-containing protein [Methanomicrobiales archaeon]